MRINKYIQPRQRGQAGPISKEYFARCLADVKLHFLTKTKADDDTGVYKGKDLLPKVNVSKMNAKSEKKRRRYQPITREHFLKCKSSWKLEDLDIFQGPKNKGLPGFLMSAKKPSLNRCFTDAEVYVIQAMSIRISSFSGWSNNSIPSRSLVDAGFSCKDPNTNIIECTACKLVFDATTLNGICPLEYHIQKSPGCEFHHQNECTSVQNSKQNRNDNGISEVPRSCAQIQREDTQVSGNDSHDISCITTANQGGDSIQPLNTNYPIEASSVNATENDNTVNMPTRIAMYNPPYKEECARRDTYRQWPHHRTLEIDTLVTAGFFYTGDEDIVRCFHCDIDLADWNPSDDPWVEHARHSPECPFIRDKKGQEYVEEIQTKWNKVRGPNHHHLSELLTNIPNRNISTGHLSAANKNRPQKANDNLFMYRKSREQYTTEMSRRETFRQWPHHQTGDIDSLVTAGFFYIGEGDIVRCFHCDIGLAEWSSEDDPWVEHARHSPECPFLRDRKGQDYIDNIQIQWASVYTPRHPEHSHIDVRRRTYENPIWQMNNVSQTPDMLADAGFYYTGEGDTVRCHYCDGGLREWEPEDDPWTEHARWFPFCKFVLKMKGVDFIHECISEQNSDIKMRGHDQPATAGQEGYANQVTYPEEWKFKEKMNPMNSTAVQTMKEFGYTTDVILVAVKIYLARTGRSHIDEIQLRDIIKDIQENENVQSLLLCKVCEEEERKIIFLPCGHIITCKKCGIAAEICSDCQSSINEKKFIVLS